MSSSNFITIWGYMFPRQIYLQERQNGTSRNALYIFELSHSDVQYATRVEITRQVLSVAQVEYSRIVPTPLELPSTTTNDALFVIVSGFSTAVRLDMDIIGDISDCRQSVMASSMYIVPCNEVYTERHIRNRAIARNDTFDSAQTSAQNNLRHSNLVNTRFRLDTSEDDPNLRLLQEEDEREHPDNDLFGSEDQHEGNNDEENGDSDDTITQERWQQQRSTPRLNRQSRQSQDRSSNPSVNQSRNRSSSTRSSQNQGTNGRENTRVTRSHSQSSVSSASSVASGEGRSSSRTHTHQEEEVYSDNDEEEFDNHPRPVQGTKRRRGLRSRV